MRKAFTQVMSALDIAPVLCDIGASGATPAIWTDIAARSMYVGFDPDQREMMYAENLNGFRKAIIFNKAVTATENGQELLFYLTRSPFCSSTLQPDSRALSQYLFADLFAVQSEVRVPAVTLNSVVDQLSLPGLDWYKADSQGTDLRLFHSLRDVYRAKVLAVDVEPGLIDAYVGEDHFVDTHKALIREGFWLSNLNVLGAVRMRDVTLTEAMAAHRTIDRRLIERIVRPSPGWCEARYLRSIDALESAAASEREYALLWIFALLDDQVGFALDIAVRYRKLFGRSAVADVMYGSVIHQLRRRRNREHLASAAAHATGPVRRLARRFWRRM